MKTSLKLFALGMILMGFGVNVNAQSSFTTAAGFAKIVSPINIAWSADLKFGSMTNSDAGTVMVDGNDVADYGTVIKVAQGDPAQSAAFLVTGEVGFTFNISLPTATEAVPYLLTRLTGSETMKVYNFTTPNATTLAIVSGGTTFKVGATLAVTASQVVGTYTNATGFEVTVNYN